MKRFISIVASVLASCAFASAQQALGPGTGLVSPEINPDHSVTFRYNNPKAITVSVAGDCIEGRVPGGDGMAATEIAAIRNSQVMIGRYRTLDDYFAESVTNIGLKGEQAEINLLSQNAVMADLRTMRDSISGVNIDEELADIIKFQHGYNAAAKFITVMDELLDTVINRIGV